MFSPLTLVSDVVGVVGSTAQNALEVIRFGGLETGEKPAPFDVVAHERVYRLRHYFPDNPADGPPLVFVPPLMLSANVYDVSTQSSAVRSLRSRGVDPWVVDFGAPEKEHAGLERTLTDHVLAVSDAIDRIREFTGRDVHVAGYSQGGMFCNQAAAYRRGAGMASIITFGSPVDTRRALPSSLPDAVVVNGAALIGGVLGRTSVSPAVAKAGFKLVSPVKTIRNEIAFLMQLHDRDALLPREAQRRFLTDEGWVGWPGPAIAELMRQFIATNRMLEGGFVIDDRVLSLADVELPVLSVIGEIDSLARASAIRTIPQAMPRADLYELSLQAGHFGLVVGSVADRVTWPTIAAWTHWCEGGGSLPERVAPARDVDAPTQSGAIGPVWSLAGAAGVAAELVGWAGSSVARTAHDIRLLAEDVAHQAPRLARLERVRPDTRISLSALLSERAKHGATDEFLLFEDRAVTYGDFNDRINAIVRGLIAIGVRRGHHVGLLMDTRPTALSAVAAINRLGAVAVLLRPDGDVEKEAALGAVRIIIAAPALAAVALAGGRPVHVLGIDGRSGPLHPDVLDMESLDPSEVDLPRWYRPDSGRACELGFLLFTGEGHSIRVSRITNGRWALSAFGTASAAAMRHTDTVYSVTPLFHPSGLLMAVGGAIAAGARIALARRFDPETFWAEVRRYGVTLSTYTWTMLAEIAAAPHDPAERYHPIRLLMGSGMPRGLSRRVSRRFAPARVLEFYASTEGTAILADPSGRKPGCKGRPLPSSAPLRIIAWDATRNRPVENEEGFAIQCGVGETGMLLAKVRGDLSPVDSPLRNVFVVDDAWQVTGDLFRRDADGDFWLVGAAGAQIATSHGPVNGRQIEEALGDIAAVDLAVAFGDAEQRSCVAAVTLRRDRQLTADSLASALSELTCDQWPDVVYVATEIPVTTAYRPSAAAMRNRDVPTTGPGLWHHRNGKFIAVPASPA